MSSKVYIILEHMSDGYDDCVLTTVVKAFTTEEEAELYCKIKNHANDTYNNKPGRTWDEKIEKYFDVQEVEVSDAVQWYINE